MLRSVSNLEVKSLAKLFRALSDETRVRIVALLTHGELCVCHLEAALDLSQPAASRHLSLLRTSGLVTRKRVGTWVYYRLATQDEDSCRRVVAAIKALASEATLHHDLARLQRTTGPGANCD